VPSAFPFARHLRDGDVEPIPDVDAGDRDDRCRNGLLVVVPGPPPRSRRSNSRLTPTRFPISLTYSLI